MEFGMTDEELAREPLSFREDLFAGKVAMVTGAGRGLGKAIAYRLARHGAKLALCGRNVERLEASAANLRKLGVEVLARPMTIRDPDAVKAFADEAFDAFGRVDVLVNNAGGQFPQAAIDYTPKGWHAVIETNLTGTWYMMQAMARKWRDAQAPGNIVNIVAGYLRGMPGIAHTCAARAGVVYLSKTLAIEWAPLNIRINCVAPGLIATEGLGVYSEEVRQDMPTTNLLRRFGTPTEVADAVCYLAGPTGAFCTGETLVIDGGNHIWGDQWTIARPPWFTQGSD
jgi:citronellol/citronellal dehydrogenase